MFAGPVEITFPFTWYIYALAFLVGWVWFAVWTSRNDKDHPLAAFLLGFLMFPLLAIALSVLYSAIV